MTNLRFVRWEFSNASATAISRYGMMNMNRNVCIPLYKPAANATNRAVDRMMRFWTSVKSPNGNRRKKKGARRNSFVNSIDVLNSNM